MEVHANANANANTINLSASSSPPSSPPLSIHSIDEPECKSSSVYPTYNGGDNPQYGAIVTSATKIPSKGKNDASGAPVAKKSRKKKTETTTAVADDKPVKEKKERKKREPRDPNAPPRKRQKVGDGTSSNGQLTLVGMMEGGSMPSQTLQPESANAIANTVPEASVVQNIKVEPEQKPAVIQYGIIQQQASTSRPQSSGQRYDPIRSTYVDTVPRTLPSSSARAAIPASTPNARASPSIASLIDPPGAYTPSRHFSATPHTAPTPNAIKPPPSLPPPASKPGPASTPDAYQKPSESIHPPPSASTPRKDNDTEIAKAMPIPQKPLTVATPPAAPSPKPARPKETLPPLPMGSGLLSHSMFGKSDTTPKEYAEVPNQCIIIDVPMTQPTGNYVNFMREVENKYGFDVAHPRLAEHRRRMAQMAAAGAAIEADLGLPDEMNLDESDGDSNAEMGGMEEDVSAQEGGGKKKRRKRANEYDKNDDFIDDAEQLWEEQAMASNNGYFVWSGPLIPESDEKGANGERAEGGVGSKRGRGKGRGGLSRGETSGRGARGGGATKGSRGGSTTRKPRATKAEKEKIEKEKVEREKLVAGFAKQPGAVPTVV